MKAKRIAPCSFCLPYRIPSIFISSYLFFLFIYFYFILFYSGYYFVSLLTRPSLFAFFFFFLIYQIPPRGFSFSFLIYKMWSDNFMMIIRITCLLRVIAKETNVTVDLGHVLLFFIFFNNNYWLYICILLITILPPILLFLSHTQLVFMWKKEWSSFSSSPFYVYVI